MPESQPAAALCQEPRPLVIAHRGFSAAAPENTLPAFELALSAEADLVELDVHQTRDGVLVVLHDATLDRTTDVVSRWKRSRVPVGDVTAAELAELDAGAWFHPRYAGTRLPTLEEALRAIANRGGLTLIERKTGEAAAYVGLLRTLQLARHVVLQSFDWEFLRRCHEMAPEILLGALGPPSRLPDGSPPAQLPKTLGPAWIEPARATGARILVWNHRHIESGTAQLMQQHGFRLWVYTVNEPPDFKAALARGVNGIITDQPARLWRLLALHRPSPAAPR